MTRRVARTAVVPCGDDLRTRSQGSTPSPAPPSLDQQDVERPRLSSVIRATPPSGTCVHQRPPGLRSHHGRRPRGHRLSHGRLAGARRERQHPVALLDPARRGPRRRGRRRAAHLSPGPDPLALMPDLIEWLHAYACDWIVLDGVDTETHAAWQPTLAYLIANLPPGTRMIITTHDVPRRVPADPADRRLTVIDREQLRADSDEAAIIALATVPGLDIDSVEEITAAAGGWVAAIRAAARYADQHPEDNPGHWLTTQGARTLLDPWLDRLPPDRLHSSSTPPSSNGSRARSATSSLRLQAASSRSRSSRHVVAISRLPAPRGIRRPSLRWWGRHPLVTAALAQRHRWSTSRTGTFAQRAGSWRTAASIRRCAISWRPDDSRRPGAI